MRFWPPLFLATAASAAAAQAPGLAVAFKTADGKFTDATVLPNIALHVEAGKPPTPFLPAGPFIATWEGNVIADLRSDFAFAAEAGGTFKLEINGAVVLEGTGPIPLGKPIQLNKGPNKLKASLASGAAETFVRLSWTEKGPNTTPIPLAALTHEPTRALQRSAQLRHGRELFLDLRCAKCHTPQKEGAPELTMDAPSFEGIGARRDFDWMVRWIFDPRAERASAHMPRLFGGAQPKAEAAATFLASLKTGADVTLPERREREGEVKDPASPLFERLHCNACHTLRGPDETNKLSLKHVAAKFPPGKLIEYLRKPDAHYAWIRMPDFRLSPGEAKEIAEFLIKDAEKPARREMNSALIDEGRSLVQNSGCLNCHSLKLENKFSAPRLSAIGADRWKRGCMAESSPATAPHYRLSAAERDALTAFATTALDSLFRHSPVEFAARQTRALNCNACHGTVEGFPPLERLGGKLKPEWAARFIAGEIPYKPRPETHPRGEPWLEARMPAFKARAQFLAHGLAALHGYPPATMPEPPMDDALAKIGQKLVGKDGGFSCVSCHGVAGLAATDVFESEGVNLAYSYDRLLRDYYYRWMRNPLAIEPQTKMPVYFEEGKSPLNEILEGDAEKQITAVWHYLRLGEKMPPPNTGEVP